ncbi:MAG: SMC-Scp complex subunit ScpB [Clostridiales bacterium]|nr:SMC-Scp complex subunit ScpB [Clostridiales bacterium]
MEIREIQAIVESLLFAAGEPVELEKIADIVDVDKKSLREIIKKMMDSYNYEKRGIHIIRLEDSYQMCTRGEYHDYVSMLMQPRRKMQLSNAAIEVLAIIAYKQPVTRSAIEHIRGVNCDYIVNRLIERKFIEEVGRLKDAPGRPILFGTTDEFLRTFGIESISDLPEFDSLSVGDEDEQMQIETAEEINQTEQLDIDDIDTENQENQQNPVLNGNEQV